MPAMRCRLAPGTYRAGGRLALYRMQGTDREVSYSTMAAGETFDVPRAANEFWFAVVWYPDFGDQRPEWLKVS